MRKSIPKLGILLVLGLFTILVMAACAKTSELPIQLPTQEEISQQEPEVVVLETDVLSEDMDSTPEAVVEETEILPSETQFVEIDETDLTEKEPPAPKTSLSATVPSGVKLASGGVQFVELFAYW